MKAREARNLSDRNNPEKRMDAVISSLLESIKKVAEDGKYRLATGYQHKPDHDIWVNGGYIKSPEWKEAKKRLEDLGYTVSFFYEERQFVDMYTLITWEN